MNKIENAVNFTKAVEFISHVIPTDEREHCHLIRGYEDDDSYIKLGQPGLGSFIFTDYSSSMKNIPLPIRWDICCWAGIQLAHNFFESLKNLPGYIKTLSLYRCHGLKDLKGDVRQVEKLVIEDCENLESFDGMPTVTRSLQITDCHNIKNIDALYKKMDVRTKILYYYDYEEHEVDIDEFKHLYFNLNCR